MKTLTPEILSLRRALEEHADAISSGAQMVLETLEAAGAPELQRRDVSRILESSVKAYRMVHERLTVGHLDKVESDEEELQRIRHDLRNLLQNVLLRGQMVLEEEDEVSATVVAEIEDILRHAGVCVDALNASRDEVGDASPHPVKEDVLPLLPTPGNDLAESAAVAGARVLIADDNENSRETLGRFLTRLGHTVAEAATGKEAVQALEESEFDLLLLDLIMPEMNGFEVLTVLRENGTLRYLPVILISGLDSEANAVRGIELGAEDFLPRPVNLKLLRARAHAAIERRRLREKELAAYFTPELARYLLRHPEELTTGRQAEVSILFCDIVGFSRVSEKLGAEQAIRWVGDILTEMSRCVMEEAGVLVDYTGDQVMAMWGAPGDEPDHADHACRCAMAMRRALPGLDEKWRDVIGRATEVSIGVNTGNAFVGNIGTEQKFKYGALGNIVNLASRVQSATKYVRCSVLITEATRRRIRISLPLRRIAEIRVNNINEPVEIHEILAEAPDESGREEMENLRDKYEIALKCFEAADFRAASALLGNLLLKYPEDGPSLLLMSRVVGELLSGDGDSFDSVWTLPGK